MRMQKAENILKAIRKLGEKGHKLERVYRNLYEPELYLMAYGRLYRNTGALTPGSNTDTVDGMSKKKIQTIIEQLREEKYNFQPARRVYIPKTRGYGKRPLGLPTFTDKLVQEVVRMMLEAYYEPRFSNHAHGFRPNRGCHTALAEIKNTFTGTVWYVEMDIKGCFDNIQHDKLIEILKEKIDDGRFINLIHRMLKAGYMEDWQYHHTYSGTPQGGVISPILANIYLDKLDRFVTRELQPQYTIGEKRKKSKAYNNAYDRMRKAHEKGDDEQRRKWQKVVRSIPTQVRDASFKRMRYVRYADDALIGVIGSKEDAEAIKTQIGKFLKDNLGVTMSEEKTLITHARSQSAKFLGHLVSTYQEDHKMTRNSTRGHYTRSINGQQRLSVPQDRIDEKCQKYMSKGKPASIKPRTLNSVAEIINSYQVEYRGFAEYYKYASNRASIGKLKNAMQGSLVKTLAQKLKISVSKVYRKYKSVTMVEGKQYVILQETIVNEGKSYKFSWGGIPLKVEKFEHTEIRDLKPAPLHLAKTELVTRLLANTCEQCGSTESTQVHHVRKLSDLEKQWKHKDKPTWVSFMIARRRKTIVLCQKCHTKVHTELYAKNLE